MSTEFIRPSWDQYFLKIAEVTASRSCCFRKQCGAVIVKDKMIISTGYNGTPKYQKNCREIGFCYRDKYNIPSGTQLEKCRAVGCHAETNAIALASQNGCSTKDATMYIYGHMFVCDQCKGMIANAGIIQVIHLTDDKKIKVYIPEKDWTIHSVDLL